MKRIHAADLFCGAGGTSTGLLRAASAAGYDVELLAVNHWDLAIATHTANHPGMRHLCESLDAIDPSKVVEGQLDILVASPACTHHSRARGGKPVDDQSRATAWHVVRWAEAKRPKWILIENVREWRDWGPIGVNGRPLKSKRGETFAAFLQALRSLGYTVDHRLLNAADYGGATTRERLFVVARRGNRRVPWPTPTHARRETSDLFGGRKPWRAAREIIDWSLPGTSIFRRKRPLAPATMRRIAAGIRRFGGPHAGAFEPFLVPFFGERDGQAPRTHSVDEPLPAVTGQGAGGLVTPFLVKNDHSYEGRDPGQNVRGVDEPVPTMTTKASLCLAQPFLLPHRVHSDSDGHVDSVDDPLRGFTASNGGGALVEPFLVSYYGTDNMSSVSQPVPTVTTKDRFGLVQPQNVDILFRMLQPHELSAAMGFPEGYQFTGNKSHQVKQIGNAVEVNMAAALCGAMLEAA